MRLIDERTADGSRHFARLPTSVSWETIRRHVSLLSGAKILNDVEKGAAATWLDFLYRDHQFTIHSHPDELRLYVRDPRCGDVVLFQVGTHFERMTSGDSSNRIY